MLSKRLNKLVDCLPHCSTLADVGCDHGYVGIQALERGVARQVIFVDISQECLNKAAENCPAAFKSNASFVCRNGLGNIRADTAAICGMGGLEIISILDGADTLPKTLVLQPMRNVSEVRTRLIKDYKITLDEKIYDGKFYDVIVAELSNERQSLTELELQFGLSNISCPTQDFADYLLWEQTKLTNILNACSSQEVRSKLVLVEQALEIIRRKQL